jgi:hypothetical protein
VALFLYSDGSEKERPDVVCCELDERLACAGRYAAIKDNAFRWDSELSGWRFVVDSTVHFFNARARWFFEEMTKRLEGKPVVFDDCPWCGEPLPNLAKLLGRRAIQLYDAPENQG